MAKKQQISHLKKKRTPVEAVNGQPTETSYFAAVVKPSANKNAEKPLKMTKSHYYQRETNKATTMTVLFERRM